MKVLRVIRCVYRGARWWWCLSGGVAACVCAKRWVSWGEMRMGLESGAAN